MTGPGGGGPAARRTGSELAGPGVVGALAGGLLWLLAYGVGYQARPDLCAVTGVAAALCWRLARLALPPAEPATYRPEPDPADDGLLVLTSLESRLSWGATDPYRFRHRVRPLLVDLATDRLRSRRGVDPRTDPEHARQILGEPLWTLMTAEPARSPGRSELTRLVEAIERI